MDGGGGCDGKQTQAKYKSKFSSFPSELNFELCTYLKIELLKLAPLQDKDQATDWLSICSAVADDDDDDGGDKQNQFVGYFCAEEEVKRAR